MKEAIYPGSFNPPTLGHLNIIQRASCIFGKLVVAVGKNPAKERGVFSGDERAHLLQEITKDIPNVEIATFEGLLVDFAKSKDIGLIVRAIRTIFDFEYETLQAQMNRHLSGVETIYLVVDEKYRQLRSTHMVEIASQGHRLFGFVPDEIEERVFNRIYSSSVSTRSRT